MYYRNSSGSTKPGWFALRIFSRPYPANYRSTECLTAKSGMGFWILNMSLSTDLPLCKHPLILASLFLLLWCHFASLPSLPFYVSVVQGILYKVFRSMLPNFPSFRKRFALNLIKQYRNLLPTETSCFNRSLHAVTYVTGSQTSPAMELTIHPHQLRKGRLL